ncbi:GDYXXLXY domain-containing protein [Nocardioides sp. KC13]|uniref:GDYXXLXY domain-containing protein n=1 Tax=Nocardioides turkmenicus TaxID=2711220 RepID=A0A6M1R8A7_9ACTN|nr:GDYXXLXY domain-containing protein [Nocardioides sp. KC13]NGN93759.1 GDYXXLXY domain-containing protein [Nocardioides sp. KC13]
MKNRTWVALVCVLDLGLVGLAVADQLSARLTGEEIRLRVEPVDPIDPFRGAYVDLGYPDISRRTTGEAGDVYVSLARRGPVWTATGVSTDRPAERPFLRCHDDGWRLSCGIESLFVPQDRAREIETEVSDGDAVAVVKVDSRGNAALVSVLTG